jgi:hypothetical protein
MARPPTPFRNEIKTRVEDELYDDLQTYIRFNSGISEAKAFRDLLRLALKGTIGTMPQPLIHSSPTSAQVGPKTPA